MKPDRMMTARLAAVIGGCWLTLGTPWAVMAQGVMYKCTLSDGRIEYTNRTNVDQNACTRLNIEPSVVIPAPAPAPRSGAAAPAPARPASTPTPAGFPRVDGATQRARDSDRKRILEEELATQQGRLAELSKVYKDGQPDRLGDERNYQKYLDRVQKLKEDISRVQGDIASIKSELSKL